MPLSFLVATDQEMLIVDAETTPQIPVSADALKPTHAYNVFAFLQNTDPLDHRDIEVTAWHDTFGIGIREKALAIVQPEPITVPGRRGDTPGVAAVNFSLITSAFGARTPGAEGGALRPGAGAAGDKSWRRRRGRTVDAWLSIPGSHARGEGVGKQLLVVSC